MKLNVMFIVYLYGKLWQQMATYLRKISNEEGTYTVGTIIQIFIVTVLTRWYGLKGDHWHGSSGEGPKNPSIRFLCCLDSYNNILWRNIVDFSILVKTIRGNFNHEQRVWAQVCIPFCGMCSFQLYVFKWRVC